MNAGRERGEEMSCWKRGIMDLTAPPPPSELVLQAGKASSLSQERETFEFPGTSSSATENSCVQFIPLRQRARSASHSQIRKGVISFSMKRPRNDKDGE